MPLTAPYAYLPKCNVLNDICGPYWSGIFDDKYKNYSDVSFRLMIG